jgi:hypothetical protein
MFVSLLFFCLLALLGPFGAPADAQTPVLIPEITAEDVARIDLIQWTQQPGNRGTLQRSFFEGGVEYERFYQLVSCRSKSMAEKLGPMMFPDTGHCSYVPGLTVNLQTRNLRGADLPARNAHPGFARHHAGAYQYAVHLSPEPKPPSLSCSHELNSSLRRRSNETPLRNASEEFDVVANRLRQIVGQGRGTL